MNPQSRGTVKLRSANADDAPHIDPQFLTHPFDRRTMIEGVRQLMSILTAPVFATKTTEKLFPKDDSEEAIMASTNPLIVPACEH